MRLTKNFELEEMVRSVTAQKRGIDNTPSKKVKENLRLLCQEVLQPLRDRWGAPIVVGSGYRCPQLNRAVGGVRNSDHLYGCAADIHALGDKPADNERLFRLAVSTMKEGTLRNVKQIIDEYHYNWIHISFQDGRTAKLGQFLHLPKYKRS